VVTLRLARRWKLTAPWTLGWREVNMVITDGMVHGPAV